MNVRERGKLKEAQQMVALHSGRQRKREKERATYVLQKTSVVGPGIKRMLKAGKWRRVGAFTDCLTRFILSMIS